MKVLVSAASKHGATTEIAEAMARTLTEAGLEVDVRRPEDVVTVAPYDGVVLGSGVYAGRWLGPMKTLIEREATALAARRVWLFSSGPIGDPPKPEAEPADVARLRELVHPVDHAIFPGRMDRNDLGFAEKAILAIVHSPTGDFRAWEPIASWASTIARTLLAAPAEPVLR